MAGSTSKIPALFKTAFCVICGQESDHQNLHVLIQGEFEGALRRPTAPPRRTSNISRRAWLYAESDLRSLIETADCK